MGWRVGGYTLQGFSIFIKTWQSATSHPSTQSVASQRQLKVCRHPSFQQLSSSGGPQLYPWHCYQPTQYLRMRSMCVPVSLPQRGWCACCKGLCILPNITHTNSTCWEKNTQCRWRTRILRAISPPEVSTGIVKAVIVSLGPSSERSYTAWMAPLTKS